jgi:glycosyltransferase involved in cell wall biosynthesis
MGSDCTVLIPTVDRPFELDQAIESVVGQSVKPAAVLIVSDGYDLPSEVIEKWAGRLNNIRATQTGARVGPSAARNAGIALADTEFVAFLDDDDLFLPNHLETCVDILRREDADMVYGGAFVCPTRQYPGRRLSKRGSRIKAHDFNRSVLLCGNIIPTSAVVVRTSMLQAFDEGLHHCEDWELWLRLVERHRLRVEFSGSVSSVYHQIPDAGGAVQDGYRTAPTPFTLARADLYSRWGSTDTLVEAGRTCLLEFDRRLDELICAGGTPPFAVFERILFLVANSIRHGVPPSTELLEQLFRPGKAGAHD